MSPSGGLLVVHAGALTAAVDLCGLERGEAGPRKQPQASCRRVVDDDTWQRSDHAPVAAILEAT